MFLELRRRINDVGRPKNKNTKKRSVRATCDNITSFTRATILKGNIRNKELENEKKRNIKHILIGFGHIFRPYYKYYLNIFAYIREKT